MKPSQPYQILIVDDSPHNIRALGEILDETYDVRFAKSGPEALEITFSEEEAIDLILLDVIMPEMDGYEVCRRLKENRKTADIPIIFITIKSRPSDEALGFSLGAVDYLNKPFSVEIVRARIRTHLELKAHRDRLQEMVQERTLELEEMNKRLQTEIIKVKAMQEDLIRSKTQAATGRLAATIAHEINSPLQGIAALLVPLMDGCEGQEDLLEIANLIEEAFHRIRETVQRLYHLNLPASRQEESVDVNSVIRKTAALLNGMARERNVAVDLDLTPDLPRIRASQGELGQVFMNLIDNALSAVQHGKQQDRKVSIQTRLVGGALQVQVSDTGTGIPEEDLPHIFEPFYTRRKAGGLGVGLSVCREIIRQCSGEIRAQNAPQGRGAVFAITLPAAPDR